MPKPLLLRLWRLRVSVAHGHLILGWQHRDGAIVAFFVLP
jgi:hypothetical protein